MPEPIRSLESTLGVMAQYGGTSWPNPWWPTGNPAYDDCAAAVSWAVFGLNSYGNPFYSYVSQIQNYFASIGRRYWGRSGIQRGDILAFSWTQDPASFDHTEIALGPVSPMGLITSRGTNANPGDDMRDRTRSAAYVVSFARPNYAGSSTPAGGGGSTIIPNQEDALSAAEVQQIMDAINQSAADVKNALRRDERYRLFKNAGTGEVIGINYDAPVGFRILYANGGEAQTDAWFSRYQIVGDDWSQALSVAPENWQTLLNLANGVDSAYTRKGKTA